MTIGFCVARSRWPAGSVAGVRTPGGGMSRAFLFSAKPAKTDPRAWKLPGQSYLVLWHQRLSRAIAPESGSNRR